MRRKETILKALLVTPEAKARYKMRDEKDLAAMSEADRRAAVAQLSETLERLSRTAGKADTTE